ncbi:MAG: hypothetical protein RI894_2086, partial [Bacteroidota bacterium]
LIFSLLLFFLVGKNTISAQYKGFAVLYSDNFEGSQTANREHYDKMSLTAAHRGFAFGTRILVRNISNGKTVIVKINDRFVLPKHAAIKLSFAAARALGISKDNESVVEMFSAPSKPQEPMLVAAKQVVAEYQAPTKPKPVKNASKLVVKAAKAKQKVAKYRVKMSPPAAKPAALSAIKWTTNQDGYELYQVAGARLEHEGYGIQLASSAQFDGIMRKIADLQALNIDGILLSVQTDKPSGTKIYKIIIGPFGAMEDAQAFRTAWLKKGLYGTFVVNLADQYLQGIAPATP